MANGNFPIQYAKTLPSGRVTSPYRQPDLAGAQATQRLGESIFQIGSQLVEQERQLQISEGRRKIDEYINSAVESVTGEEEADDKLWEKLQGDINSVKYSRITVNSELDQYRNQIMPGTEKLLNNRHNEMYQKNVHDQLEAEGQTQLANGDLVAYQDILDRRLQSKDITPAEYKSLTSSALGDSLIEQARDLLASDNPADNNRAMGILDNIKQVENLNLSTAQKEYVDKLRDRADKNQKKAIDKVGQQYWQYLKADDFASIEESLSDPQNALPITGDGGKNWWHNLIQSRLEKLNTTDPDQEASTLDAIIFNPDEVSIQSIRNRASLGIHGGLSIEKVSEFEEKYRLKQDRTSALNSPIARTFFNELKNAQQDRVFAIDPGSNNKLYGQSLDSLSDWFIDFRKKKDRDPTLDEAQGFYQNLTAGYRSPAQPFTEAKVQTVLGELQSGGSVSIYGTVLPFNRPQDAVNHLLRNLGPNWQKIAPQAVDILKEKFPEAELNITTPTVKVDFEEGDTMIYNGDEYVKKDDGKWHKIVK